MICPERALNHGSVEVQVDGNRNTKAYLEALNKTSTQKLLPYNSVVNPCIDVIVSDIPDQDIWGLRSKFSDSRELAKVIGECGVTKLAARRPILWGKGYNAIILPIFQSGEEDNFCGIAFYAAGIASHEISISIFDSATVKSKEFDRNHLITQFNELIVEIIQSNLMELVGQQFLWEKLTAQVSFVEIDFNTRMLIDAYNKTDGHDKLNVYYNERGYSQASGHMFGRFPYRRHNETWGTFLAPGAQGKKVVAIKVETMTTGNGMPVPKISGKADFTDAIKTVELWNDFLDWISCDLLYCD